MVLTQLCTLYLNVCKAKTVIPICSTTALRIWWPCYLFSLVWEGEMQHGWIRYVTNALFEGKVLWQPIHCNFHITCTWNSPYTSMACFTFSVVSYKYLLTLKTSDKLMKIGICSLNFCHYQPNALDFMLFFSVVWIPVKIRLQFQKVNAKLREYLL